MQARRPRRPCIDRRPSGPVETVATKDVLPGVVRRHCPVNGLTGHLIGKVEGTNVGLTATRTFALITRVTATLAAHADRFTGFGAEDRVDLYPVHRF